MTHDDPGLDDEVRLGEATLRALRDASSPDLAPGAAERIAAGAWSRAAALRANRAPRILAFRRTAVAGAAAVLVAAAILILRGTDPAFAVEGDPVMVEHSGAWEETRSVPADCLVKVPDGDRVLHSRGGGMLRPLPGSLFQIQGLRVLFRSGGGDVEGGNLVVEMPDNALFERDPAAKQYRLSFSVGATDGTPEVQVTSGSAQMHCPWPRQVQRMGSGDKAAPLAITQAGATRFQWTLIKNYSPRVEDRMADGFVIPVDVGLSRDGRVQFLLGNVPDRSFFACEVSRAEASEVAARVNAITQERRIACASASSPARSIVYEKGTAKLAVTVEPSGRVRVQGRVPGRVESCVKPRTFADIASLRREAPDVAALFGDTLDK